MGNLYGLWGEWAGVMGNLWGTCMGYGRKKKGQACACPCKIVGYHFHHCMCLPHTLLAPFGFKS